MYNFDSVFPRYKEYSPNTPVWCLTPNEGCYTHRFFDTIPISPSGRYLAVLNMPYEDKRTQLNDRAKVVVIDLFTGIEQTVDTTAAWEHQLGANINWGSSDAELIYNEIDTKTYEIYAVCLDFKTGKKRKLEHTVYHVSPDGKKGVSSNLAGMRKTQYGYGIIVPDELVPLHTIDTQDDGIWVTDINTGKAKMILSIKDIFDQTHTRLERSFLKDGLAYCFHTKWSPDGKKIMFSTRYISAENKDRFDLNAYGLVLYCVYTCNEDGSDLSVAIDETQWVKGGHHTTWSPDGKYLTMNLRIECNGLKLCRADLKGRHVEKLIDGVLGSGHPSINKNRNIMITDTYQSEPTAYKDGTVPIRVIDLDAQRELEPAVRMNVSHPFDQVGKMLRVDLHPVWDKSARYCIFNGHTDGCRRVFITDLQRYLD